MQFSIQCLSYLEIDKSQRKSPPLLTGVHQRHGVVCSSIYIHPGTNHAGQVAGVADVLKWCRHSDRQCHEKTAVNTVRPANASSHRINDIARDLQHVTSTLRTSRGFKEAPLCFRTETLLFSKYQSFDLTGLFPTFCD